MKTELLLNRTPWSRGIEVLIQVSDRREDGEFLAYAAPLELKRVTREMKGMVPTPTFRMDENDAQRLMDELWHIGLRPSEGSGSAGALAATQRHLEDMKSVAFHALKLKR